MRLLNGEKRYFQMIDIFNDEIIEHRFYDKPLNIKMLKQDFFLFCSLVH